MNAAERYFAATRAGDSAAARSNFAPDVELFNPATTAAVVGADRVCGQLDAVAAACDSFRHTRLLATVEGEPPVYALAYEATIGDETLQGVDLVELDVHDRIRRFTVLGRPMSALAALGRRMGAPPPGAPGS